MLDEVGADNVFVQYDIYHAQRMEGELAATMSKHLARIGHIQLADNPGRNEPGTGEINYPFLFAHLDRIGYNGWIGCEYKPAASTEAGLGWLEQARRTCAPPLNRHERQTDMTSTHLKLGFIGLGIMGTPMAGHLIAAGHAAVRRTRAARCRRRCSTPAPRACANAAGSGRARRHHLHHGARHARRGGGAVRRDGVAAGLSAGKTVVDMSSISPIATKDFAQKINELGCDYLDAPVSGGEVGAKAASLTIMVGGPEAAFERVKPLFELMGKNITLVGGNGDGQTTKVANQIIVALNIEAVGEALVFASKAGADPAKVRQALMGGFASSRILEVHGERMIKRTFNPGFRIGLHQKDLNLALQGARALGVALPHTANAAQLMQACAAHGMADLDHSALVRALEMMAAHQVAPG